MTLTNRLPHFFFNDTATTEIYTLSLHDALPISACRAGTSSPRRRPRSWWPCSCRSSTGQVQESHRSEEHTSELQSRQYLVCRLLLEKKKIPFFGYTKINKLTTDITDPHLFSSLV